MSPNDSVAPTVSVVIASHNYGHFLAESVESVLSQTWRDLELIVVDDGSTDATRQVIGGFAHDTRLRYVWQERRGQAAAFNRGLAMARGRYLALHAADDVWLPHKLARQVEVLESRPEVGLVYTNTTVVDARGEFQHFHFRGGRVAPAVGWVLPTLVQRNFVPAPSVLLRREVLDVVGRHDESLEVCEDWDLWLRVAKEVQFGYIDEPLVRIRRHGGNTHLRQAPSLRDPFRVLDRFPKVVVPWEALGRGVKGWAYANVCTEAAGVLYDAGAHAAALAQLGRAALLQPRAISWHELRLAVKCALGLVGLRPGLVGTAARRVPTFTQWVARG